MIELETRQDVALARRAVNEGWPIPDTYRKIIILKMMEIIASGEASDRDKVAAAKTVMKADQINHQVQKDEGVEQGRNRILEIAEQIRARRSADNAVGGTAGTVIEGAKRTSNENPT